MSKHELTTRIAYEIYLQRGRAPGRSREDWAAAEAVVALCLAFAAALLEAEPPQPAAEPQPVAESAEGAALPDLTPVSPVAPVFSAQERAFALLCTAAKELGRAELAKTLGYKSTSSVGPYLRGKRPIGAKLAERILANLTPQPAALRRAA
tara:strand:- start:539 stop:991 length:453 start_codon:yes stop_codon:yes gene_type:complete